MKKHYENIEILLRSENPHQPVYCIYPNVYRESTMEFIEGFPGRVLYAVKANNHPEIIKLLYEHGIKHFDCASLEEIRLLRTLCPEAEIYFMNPVRFEGDAANAQHNYSVRHFVIDDESGLVQLLSEIDAQKSTIFARMAVSHHSASQDLSYKFGALPKAIPALLRAIKENGAEPALAYNVGTSVTSPDAYVHAMGIAEEVLSRLPFRIRLLDIGGGFPKSYPGFRVPEISSYLQRLQELKNKLAITQNTELMAEPGRALSAPGLSALTRVLLRKADKIFLNDGMYGVFWELRCQAHLQYPYRVFRQGQILTGKTQTFSVFGPTCDSSDELPVAIELPGDIDVGDHIEFGNIGAYSLSGRTDFNGFYSDNVVSFTDENAIPPLLGT
ncbi:MAG: hypothetical protein GKR93_15810 [Gammaproteobacteria bacterium]|nr:hypothetical protein [Gammaproteobacteria bacterium]